MISNLSTHRLPQSISVSLISPYLGPHILGLLRTVWDFLSSVGLCGDDVPPRGSGGRGRSVRSVRAFFSDFFFPESKLSFKLSPLSALSAVTRGIGKDNRLELTEPVFFSFSLTGATEGAFFLSRCSESSLTFPSLSLAEWCSLLLLTERSEGDCGALIGGVRGPFSGGGEGGRPFLVLWLDFGLGWCAAEEPLVGVDVLLEFLALAAASAALAFFCLLSSAARLVLNVSVLGERLDGRLRDRE